MTAPVNTGRILATAVATEVQRGGRVVSQSDVSAFVEFGKPTKHLLHLVLTLVTFGAWALVWLCVWLYNVQTSYTVHVTVDEYGNVLTNRLS